MTCPLYHNGAIALCELDRSRSVVYVKPCECRDGAMCSQPEARDLELLRRRKQKDGRR
jgi:hypothetical protein